MRGEFKSFHEVVTPNLSPERAGKTDRSSECVSGRGRGRSGNRSGELGDRGSGAGRRMGMKCAPLAWHRPVFKALLCFAMIASGLGGALEQNLISLPQITQLRCG